MYQQMASQLGTDLFPLRALSVYDFRERDDMLFAFLIARGNGKGTQRG